MTTDRIRVLLIEDDPDYARLVESQLCDQAGSPFRLEHADTLHKGLQRLAQGEPDVILLDLVLPESQGLETYARVYIQVPHIPVVVLTAFETEPVALEAVRNGAQDFVDKAQADRKRLTRAIQYAIERQRLQMTLRNLSLLDELTGLYNRRGFLRLASQQMKLADRTRRSSLLIAADLDGLKLINDQFGHPEGDRALTEAGRILKQAFRASDVAARVGGDEFMIFAIEARVDGQESIVARLQQRLEEANTKAPRPYPLSFSVGVVRVDPELILPLEELMAQADEALYEQKRAKHASPARPLAS